MVADTSGPEILWGCSGHFLHQGRAQLWLKDFRMQKSILPIQDIKALDAGRPSDENALQADRFYSLVKRMPRESTSQCSMVTTCWSCSDNFSRADGKFDAVDVP